MKVQIQNRMSDTDASRMFFRRHEIATALDAIKFSFEDIRSSNDPSSKKKLCTANLKAILPEGFLKDADRRLTLSQLPAIEVGLARISGQRSGSTFVMPAHFDVQPTDDGTKTFAEMVDADATYNFLAILLVPHLSERLFDELDRNEARRDQMLAADQTGDDEEVADSEPNLPQADATEGAPQSIDGGGTVR
ncbi:hypothetical protein WBP07_12525 [Novosphingobium sp. BL-8A]|uniref:hypothetical protein n=1 Tax=Novosphingobium sp. BL-8A TaxID=3127639 RepID=UPI0037571769